MSLPAFIALNEGADGAMTLCILSVSRQLIYVSKDNNNMCNADAFRGKMLPE
jgi:hypothetical protein